MPRTHAITLAALGFAAAAIPALARAEGQSHPQEEARIERLIEDAIRGNSEADRQEQARIDRLVQQSLQRAGTPGAAAPGGDANLLAGRFSAGQGR